MVMQSYRGAFFIQNRFGFITAFPMSALTLWYWLLGECKLLQYRLTVFCLDFTFGRGSPGADRLLEAGKWAHRVSMRQ